jgi:hypothetical protein
LFVLIVLVKPGTIVKEKANIGLDGEEGIIGQQNVVEEQNSFYFLIIFLIYFRALSTGPITQG